MLNLILRMNYSFRALDGICAKNGAFPMDVIGLITVSVLKGLTYLYHNHKIVHRGMSDVQSFGTTCSSLLFSHMLRVQVR